MANQFYGGIRAGSTDVSVWVVLRDTADNTETTGVAHTSVTGSYIRQGGSRTAITMADLAAITSTHADGGWEEADATNLPGLYRFDVPDAAFAAGADSVVVSVVVAGSYAVHREFALEYSLQARTGTAQAGAAGTITLDAAASATHDFYNGGLVVLTAGTGLGQAREVTDYDGTSKVATVNENWVTAPDATSVFVIQPGPPYTNPPGIKKNTALADFTFPMVDATDGLTLETGLTVTAERSLDGAAFASCANAVAEIGTTGVYAIDLAAADLNADTVTLKFAAAGAATRVYTIVTEP